MSFSTPGAIDLHVHLREPGNNTAETIESGTRAALLGGFVMVADMPNNPGMPVHSLERLVSKHTLSEKTAWIPTAFYAGAQPETYEAGNLTAMADDAIGLKLYGDPTTGNQNTYEAAEFREIVQEWHAATPSKPIMFHPGVGNLQDMIGLVAQDNDHPLHVCHVSNGEQIAYVQDAQRKGLIVTTGVTPHHLLKTSHDVYTEGKFAEMKPPLARADEADALLWMLDEGIIDVVETDFAPHSLEAKFEAEHEGSDCYGVPGIENVLPLLFYQVKAGRLSMDRLVDATFTRPSRILGVRLDETTVVQWSDELYRIGDDDVAAKCGWTPYMGMLAIGRVEYARIGGRTVVSNGNPLEKHPEVVEQRGHLIF